MGRKSEQNYKKLRKHHKELGVPWTDSTFPANDSSIGLKKVGQSLRLAFNEHQLLFQARTIGRVEWRRITDLSQQPRLVTGSVERCEVVQGKYGSGWFVSALSVLAGARKLWEKVVIDYDHQEWSHENASESYTGIFKFKFWRDRKSVV